MIIKGRRHYLYNRCDDYFLPEIKKNNASKKANFKVIALLFSYLLQGLGIIFIGAMVKVLGVPLSAIILISVFILYIVIRLIIKLVLKLKKIFF